MKAIVVFYPTIMKSFKKSDHVKVCNGDVCIEADGAAGQIINALVIAILIIAFLSAVKVYLK